MSYRYPGTNQDFAFLCQLIPIAQNELRTKADITHKIRKDGTQALLIRPKPKQFNYAYNFRLERDVRGYARDIADRITERKKPGYYECNTFSLVLTKPHKTNDLEDSANSLEYFRDRLPNFRRAMRRHLGKETEFMSVLESHAMGGIHAHVIMQLPTPQVCFKMKDENGKDVLRLNHEAYTLIKEKWGYNIDIRACTTEGGVNYIAKELLKTNSVENTLRRLETIQAEYREAIAEGKDPRPALDRIKKNDSNKVQLLGTIATVKKRRHPKPCIRQTEEGDVEYTPGVKLLGVSPSIRKRANEKGYILSFREEQERIEEEERNARKEKEKALLETLDQDIPEEERILFVVTLSDELLDELLERPQTALINNRSNVATSPPTPPPNDQIRPRDLLKSKEWKEIASYTMTAEEQRKGGICLLYGVETDPGKIAEILEACKKAEKERKDKRMARKTMKVFKTERATELPAIPTDTPTEKPLEDVCANNLYSGMTQEQIDMFIPREERILSA